MAHTTVDAGTTRTTRLTMNGFDTLFVEATGEFDVTANNQTVRFTTSADGAVILNEGILENTAAAGRAIRFEETIATGSLYATVHNNGTISSNDDALQIDTDEDATDGSALITSGLLLVNNTGTWTSVLGQAIDAAGGFDDFELHVNNTGTISSVGDGIATEEGSDAIRFQAIGIVNNSGDINGGTDAGYDGTDGVEYEDGTSGTVTNKVGGTISGDRHAINMGENSVVTVINSGTLSGRNGSGVGSDGTATVTNNIGGIIRGEFANITGSDVNGPAGEVPDGINDGDGDGIDIDGRAIIVNFGLIEGTGAGGHGSDGLANTSEGIAAGGGTITNHSGATISGAGLGILIDNSSQGNAPFLTTITNDGTIAGVAGVGIRIISVLDDVIVNNGTITGGAGVAIRFGNGDNTLRIGTNSAITGVSNGEGGINTLDYVGFGLGGTTINLFTGTATGTGGVASFQTVLGSAGVDAITGNNAANTINARAGNDTLTGGLGKDTLTGGLNNDTFIFAAKTHSAATHLAADIITDFDDNNGNDTINLAGIYSAKLAYIHAAAFTKIGQVRINDIAGADVIVEVNTGGTLASDFSIRLSATTLASMTASDFVL